MRDPRLIAKVKTTWDYCRNDIMHFGGQELSIFGLCKKRDEINEIILEVYTDLYGKSVSTDEISDIYSKESSKQFNKTMRNLSRKTKKTTGKKKVTKRKTTETKSRKKKL